MDDHESLVRYHALSYSPPGPTKPVFSIETDIFAFGCTVFEIKTGRPPFYNETHHISFDGGLSYVDDHYKRR
jgi:hypothetical protein